MRLLAGLKSAWAGVSYVMNSDSQTKAPSLNERRRGDKPLRILIADDDRDTVEMLTVILRNEGHIVQGCYSGKEVLPIVPGFRPDAIIMDINVPGLSGYAVARAIRHSFSDMRRPLMIAISGVWKETPDRMIAEEVGFDHHLLKPADPHELLGLLEPLRRRSSN